MDNYEVVGLLGEGSFGRVYKAKQVSNSQFVALKVISKRGRSAKELKGLRRECEIQRYLHHPNIIQMLDSFETENEIVVITEFAHKELNVILGKEGYLPEDRVQTIVWDLVSALYYLHSHRVLHRDLKPQNILLDSKNCAKLCDFGFARNMSTGTHVLTSIKGTPLYMAPELIEERPYDHNADLWSLGCIIYELLVGAPPFCTASILHLIRLIRHEQIQWPTLISEDCVSFLKGLLQKNPSKRMTWPEILNHPFVKGHILISSDSTPSMPLTRPMSANTLQAKEQQKKDHCSQKNSAKSSRTKTPEVENSAKARSSRQSRASENSNNQESCSSKSAAAKDARNNNTSSLQTSLKSLSLEEKKEEKNLPAGNEQLNQSKTKSEEDPTNSTAADVEDQNEKRAICKQTSIQQSFDFQEDSYPLENEEWVVFLQRSIEEAINGEVSSLSQPNLTNIIISPLKNTNASSKVVAYVASLLSLPFVVPGTSDENVQQIKKTYLDVKLVPNLVYSCKLLMRQKSACESSSSASPTPTNTPTATAQESYRSFNDLSEEDLQAIEYIFLLICHLVHLSKQFLAQFCDAVAILNIYNLLKRLLLLSKRRLRLVTDVISILTQALRKLPENHEIINQIILSPTEENEESVNYVDLLRHSSPVMRERMCFFLLVLAKHSINTLETMWDVKMRETLEALMYDSIESVRNAAEMAVEEVKVFDFY